MHAGLLAFHVPSWMQQACMSAMQYFRIRTRQVKFVTWTETWRTRSDSPISCIKEEMKIWVSSRLAVCKDNTSFIFQHVRNYAAKFTHSQTGVGRIRSALLWKHCYSSELVMGLRSSDGSLQVKTGLTLFQRK